MQTSHSNMSEETKISVLSDYNSKNVGDLKKPKTIKMPNFSKKKNQS